MMTVAALTNQMSIMHVEYVCILDNLYSAVNEWMKEYDSSDAVTGTVAGALYRNSSSKMALSVGEEKTQWAVSNTSRFKSTSQ